MSKRTAAPRVSPCGNESIHSDATPSALPLNITSGPMLRLSHFNFGLLPPSRAHFLCFCLRLTACFMTKVGTSCKGGKEVHRAMWRLTWLWGTQNGQKSAGDGRASACGSDIEFDWSRPPPSQIRSPYTNPQSDVGAGGTWSQIPQNMVGKSHWTSFLCRSSYHPVG